jgi:hypothetical protein
MDKTWIIVVVVAALAAAIVFAVNRYRQFRARRPIMELLNAYFRGEASLDQVARRAREVAPRHFTSGDEFQSLTVAAFQSAAEAKFAHKPHSMKDESELLHLLAALKNEFGLPDRYRLEERPGRE